MKICFEITKTPQYEWENIYMSLIDDNVCKYIIQKGVSRGTYCLKHVKFKDKLYFYKNNYVHLCHTHKYIVENPNYYQKKNKRIKTIPERNKKK